MDSIFKYTYINKIAPSFTLNLSNLVSFYMPLIDSKAMALYLHLANEKNFDSVFKTNQKDLIDLLRILSISFDEFESYRRTLEAFGLVKTYISFDEINHVRSFLFEINQPLSFSEFINNNKYKKSFINKVGIERFQELEFYYDTHIEPRFNKVNDNFDDIFEQFQTASEYVFDFEILSKNISKLARANILLDDESKKIIELYFNAFSVTTKDIEVAVMNATTFVDDNLIVDKTLLELELSHSVNHSNNIFSSEIIDIKRVPNFFNKKQDDLVKKEIFIQYRNISPESFLSSLQKYQIGEHEIELIKRLRKDFHLTNDIINILLDYSIFKTHGKVNDLYIEKTAKSLNMIGVKNVTEAYNYFYNISTSVRNKNKEDVQDIDSLKYVDLFN